MDNGSENGGNQEPKNENDYRMAGERKKEEMGIREEKNKNFINSF
jgi:hypothetical protein